MQAFVPHPLPPIGPPFRWSKALSARLEQATEALRRVDLAAELVPSTDWFLYAFIRMEAVVSSQIEGTQATLVDLLTAEGDPTRSRGESIPADVVDVSNHVVALEYALKEIRVPKGLPLSIRLLNEAHRRLLTGVRGALAEPGELRRSQNWIGGTRPGNAVYVPPPSDKVASLLGALEKYIHQPDDLSPLVRVALVHAQFESIHPYLDGNGRIGRLLITLLLHHWQLVRSPILYLSLYFKIHRAEYYRLLAEIRTKGDWESWVAFFLEAVIDVSRLVVETGRDVFLLISNHRRQLMRGEQGSVTAFRLFELLPSHPIVTVARVTSMLGVTKPTAGKAIEFLQQEKILVEVSGKKKDRVYRYHGYLERLRGDMEARAESGRLAT